MSQAVLDGISIQSQKVQEENQDKKEKPKKETVSKEEIINLKSYQMPLKLMTVKKLKI